VLLKLKHADANGQKRPPLCALIWYKEQASHNKPGGIKCFLKTKTRGIYILFDEKITLILMSLQAEKNS
jgi:hypothetical protein